jgi:hypothetical protein
MAKKILPVFQNQSFELHFFSRPSLSIGKATHSYYHCRIPSKSLALRQQCSKNLINDLNSDSAFPSLHLNEHSDWHVERANTRRRIDVGRRPAITTYQPNITETFRREKFGD